jgi:hypothetical protein
MDMFMTKTARPEIFDSGVFLQPPAWRAHCGKHHVRPKQREDFHGTD